MPLSSFLQANVLSPSLRSNQPITPNYNRSEHTVILVLLGKQLENRCFFPCPLFILCLSFTLTDYSTRSIFEAPARLV